MKINYDDKIGFGKYKDDTLISVIIKDINYIIWLNTLASVTLPKKLTKILTNKQNKQIKEIKDFRDYNLNDWQINYM